MAGSLQNRVESCVLIALVIALLGAMAGAIVQRKLSSPRVTVVMREGAATWRVNVNTASLEELTLLPRIGPAKAKAIIGYREKNGPIRSMQELARVPGIGEKLAQELSGIDSFDNEDKAEPNNSVPPTTNWGD